MPLALYALAVATFAIGTTEFVVVGLIPGISADLGVSISTAGLLVSLYALSITLGTPIFSALTGAFPRRRLAIALMAVFTVCNLSAAVASSYSTLLLSRIVMAVAHGVFFGVGAACATSLVSKSKAGSAVALMMGGLTVAMVVGVPLGSWIGQLFDWRTPFLIVTAMGTVAVIGLIWLLPHEISYQPPAPFLAQLSLLGNRHLATMYLLTAIGFGGTFVVFTFLSPLLTDVTGVPKETVNIALLLFGGATVVGNLAGGRLTDAVGTRKAMMILLCGLIVSFVLITVGNPQRDRDLRGDGDLGDLCLCDPTRHAGRRRGHGRASGSRRACDRVRLQHRGLQSRDIRRVLHWQPAIERARAVGDALRIDRDGGDCAADRDGRAPPAAGKRRSECRVNWGSIR